MPFASGFVTALNAFPNGLLSMTDEGIEQAMDRVARHLPCSDDDERAAMAELDAEHPLKTLDQAVEDMVLAVVEIDSLTESERYRVKWSATRHPSWAATTPATAAAARSSRPATARPDLRLQLISDLHLERDPAFQPQAVPEADVLVLAGDIGSYQAGSRLPAFGPEADWGLSRFSPRQGAPWKRVLYVPGNHEYDGLPWPQAQAQLRACCDRLGIEWLDREQIVIDGVRFLGCTLWADFDLLVDPRSPWPPSSRHATRPTAPPTSTCAASARWKATNPCWPTACASWPWPTRTGCGPPWPSPSRARLSWSRTSRPALAAPTRATA